MSYGPIADHAHKSELYRTKRPSTCKGCTVYDDATIWKQTPIGERTSVIKVTSGSGPGTRTAFYHEECYFTLRNEIIANFFSPAWKVQRAQPLRLVESDPETTTKTIDAEQGFALDDVPFQESQS